MAQLPAAMLSAVSDAFFTVDDRLRLLYVNPAAAKFFGVASESLLGRALGELDPANCPVELVDVAGRSVHERRPASFDLQDPRHGRWYAVRVYVAESGAAVLLLDVTDRKTAEDALRLSEAKFAGMVSISSDAIVSVDEGQRIIHFNRGAEEMFGYRADEVIGQALDILLPQRFRGRHVRQVNEFAAGRVVARRMGERREVFGVRRNGEEFPADASISKLSVAGQRILTAVLRDVSTRRQHEEDQRFLAHSSGVLAASLEFGATLQTIADLAVARVADLCAAYGFSNGDTVHACAALSKQYATRPVSIASALPVAARRASETGALQLAEPLVDGQAEDFLPDTITPPFEPRSALALPLLIGSSVRGVVVLLSARQRRYGQEGLTLAQLFVSRATFALENARLYEQAQRAVQARDDVLAFLSHDLGNPLAAIRIASAVLMRRLDQSSDAAEARQVLGIRQAVEQMQRLISDLLDVRRIEAGQLRLNREPVSVSGLLHESKAMVEAIAAEKQIDVAVNVENDLPYVSADRERLLQVLSNLLGNALKYSTERTRVNVSARREGNALIVDVVDQGQGIDAEDLPYIFDRYWQARRRGAAGHGLGLAIVHGIVEAHGGRVWAESKLGIGSRFTFSMPL